MTRILVLLTMLLSVALAGAGPGLAGGGSSKPKFLTSLHLLPGRPAQGVWQLRNGRFLITQDIDGKSASNWVRFCLMSAKGDILEKWELQYGTHGQGVFAMNNGDGLTVFTETRNHDGLAQFALSKDRKSMDFVREIKPRTADGKPIDFKAFGVDEDRDEIVLVRGSAYRTVQYFRFSDFLQGRATPVGKKTVIQTKRGLNLGSLQGVGTTNGIVFVLAGDDQIGHKKYLLRIGDDGAFQPMPLTAGRGRAMFKYEPEALFVQKGRVIFGVYDHFWTRLYEMSAY
jgi:hypothetical protein